MILVFISCGEVSTNSAQVSNEDDMASYGKSLYETQCTLCHGEKGNAKIAQASVSSSFEILKSDMLLA